MNRSFNDLRSRESIKGFSLVELIVVVGLIAVLAGGIGLSLGKGNASIALQNSQGTLTSAFSGVRAQAALHLTDAALFVNSTPGDDGFMRELRIAIIDNSVAPPVWKSTGDPIFLSKDIFVVPPLAAFLPAEIVYLPGNTEWNLAHSTAYDQTTRGPLKMKDRVTNVSPANFDLLVRLTSQGRTSAGVGRIILAPGDVMPGGVGLSFKDTETLRGAKISNYGVAIPVDGQEAFN